MRSAAETRRGSNWTGSRFRYTGQIAFPEASLYHYKARVYDPVLGRFLQTDPVGFEADQNLYAYVGNDPINRTDPTGTKEIRVPVGGCRSRVGATSSPCTSSGGSRTTPTGGGKDKMETIDFTPPPPVPIAPGESNSKPLSVAIGDVDRELQLESPDIRVVVLEDVLGRVSDERQQAQQDLEAVATGDLADYPSATMPGALYSQELVAAIHTFDTAITNLNDRISDAKRWQPDWEPNTRNGAPPPITTTAFTYATGRRDWVLAVITRLTTGP